MKKTVRGLVLLLAVVLAASLLPTMALANGDPITITVTEDNSSSATLSTGSNYVTYRSWTAAVASFEGLFTGTIYMQTGSFDPAYTVTFCDDGQGNGISVGDTGKNTNTATNNSTAYATLTVTGKTASEIQSYLNNTLYMKAEGTTVFASGKFWPGLTDLTGLLNIDGTVEVPSWTVSVVQSSGSGSELGSMGAGTVTVNGTAVAVGSSTTIAKGTELTVVLTPGADSYIAAYSVTGSADSGSDVQFTEAKTITVAPDSDVTVSVLFIGKESGVADSDRDAGQLKWAEEVGNDNSISYKEAVADNGFDFNARVNTYVLNSNFGQSVTYGENPLPDPSVYLSLSLNNSDGDTAQIKVGEPTALKSLGQLGGTSPAQGGAVLAVSPDRSEIFPGEVEQVVYADYTTASSICGNHWYHVYGVQGHTDGITRTFTIEKDVLGFHDGDVNTAVAGSYTFTADANGQAVLALDAKLLPDTYGMTNSKIANITEEYTVWYSESQNGSFEKVDGYEKAGFYQLRNEAVAETKYLQAYAAEAITAGFEALRGNNPDDVVAPELKLAATSITVTNIQDDQKYSIDNSTWLTAAELKAQDGKFSGLTEDTEYTVYTLLPQTDTWLEERAGTNGTTYVTVMGSLQLAEGDEASKPLLTAGVIVTFTDAQGNSFTAEVQADGTYAGEVPAGTYTVSSVDPDGLQSGSMSGVTVANDNADAPEAIAPLTVKDTDKGTAKKFLDANLTDNGAIVNTVSSATIDQILAADAKAEEADLSDGVKGELDKLLGYAGTPATFDGMVAAAEAQVAATAKEYGDALGTVSKNADGSFTIPHDKMDTITGLAEKWPTLSEAEKQAVNDSLGYDFATLKSANEELAAKNAQDFIDTYVTDAEGEIVKSVDENSADAVIANILAGGSEFFGTMNQTERDAVNKALAENGGDSFEELYADAREADLAKQLAKLEQMNLTDAQKEQIAQYMTDASEALLDVLTDPDATVADKAMAEAKLNAAMELLTAGAEELAAINDAKDAGKISEDEAALLTATVEELIDAGLEDIADAQNAAQAAQSGANAMATLGTMTEAREAVEAIEAMENLSDGQKEDYIEDIMDKVEAVGLWLSQSGSVDDYAVKNAVTALEGQIGDTMDEAIATDFVQGYVSAKSGNGYQLYSGINSDNADQILSGQSVWATMSDEQKALADGLIAAGNGAIDGAPTSYEAFLTAVASFADAQSDEFIETYLTGADGEVFKTATRDNYAQILSGKAAWDKMSQAEKDAVNAKLLDYGSKTYEELLAMATDIEAQIKAQKNVPDTGDDSRIGLWAAALLLSMMALAAVAVSRKARMKG